jgi:hypothetical protein
VTAYSQVCDSFFQMSLLLRDNFTDLEEIQIGPSILADNTKVWLVETRSFYDSHSDNVEILRRMANWLNIAYKMKVEFMGIIYLYSIGDARYGFIAERNLRIFKNLCGDQAMGSVVLATTFWDSRTAKPTDQVKSKDCENIGKI